jgi:hypothetical protein
VNGVRDLRDQAAVAPAVTLLEDHQPHVGLDRDRRPSMLGCRGPRLERLALPAPYERREQPRTLTTVRPTLRDRRATRVPRSAAPRPTTSPPARPPTATSPAPLAVNMPICRHILTIRPDRSIASSVDHAPSSGAYFRGK